MEFLDEVGTEYEGVPSLASGLFGISGVVVGSRRFYLARLKHADDLRASWNAMRRPHR